MLVFSQSDLMKKLSLKNSPYKSFLLKRDISEKSPEKIKDLMENFTHDFQEAFYHAVGDIVKRLSTDALLVLKKQCQRDIEYEKGYGQENTCLYFLISEINNEINERVSGIIPKGYATEVKTQKKAA